MAGERYSLTDKLLSRKTALHSFYTQLGLYCNKKIKAFFFCLSGIFEIFRSISKFQNFLMYSYIFHDFSRNPVRCSAEPWFGTTAL